MAEGVRRREPAAARVLHRGGGATVRESRRERWEEVEGGEEVLTAEAIDGGVTGEEGAEEMAAAAGVEEDPACAALRLMILKIEGGLKLPVVLGAP